VPVLVTGAATAVGRHAVRLLAGTGGEVRVFLQLDAGGGGTAEALAARYREVGCKVALGDLDDEAHVESALEQVHTLLHLLGRPTDDPAAHLDRTATVVSAAIGAGCRRLVVLSDLAAADPAGNPWLEALAQAEDLVADAPMERVVLRAAVTHGEDDPLTVALAAGALGEAPPGAHWPVAAVDVATTAVLADRERDVDGSLHVVVAVAGPRRMTTADYVRALRAHVAAGPGDPLPAAARELMGRVVERPDDAVGIRGRSLDDGI
jgi:uncharacterized protein YbjT (DUF2867 family)